MAEQENTEQKTKKSMLSDRMRQRYPDLNVEDDELMSGQIMDDYDALEKENSGYKDRESKIVDMYTADPRSAYFMESWRKGNDPAIELIRTFGDELREALDNPDKQEELAAANKEYLDRVTENKKLQDEFESNMAQTLEHLKSLADEGKMQDEQIDDVMEHLFTIVHDGIVGKFSPETISMVAKALNYDNDVAEASHVGEVRGRNAKIDEKLKQSNKSDGISHLSGKNNAVPNPRRRMSMFDLAKEA